MAKKKQQNSRRKARRDKGSPAKAPAVETATKPLSGTASDGVEGLRAIKAAGRTIIAQRPETAKFDGMPRAAIATGKVDMIMPPDEIGPALVKLEAQQRELREARLLLEASRDACAELDDFAPIPYFTLDRKGVVKEANLIGCSLLEVERARLIGLPLLSFVADLDRPAFLDHLRQCRTGALEVSSELNVKSRSGKTVPVLLTSRLAATGDIDVVRTVMADISAQRQAEADIRDLNATLDQRVRERTAELVRANENLRHEVLQRQAAESALQKADRTKDDFLAMLGHELRNPLGTLLQAIELWRSGNTAASRLEQVEAIAVRQVRHIARLVDDLLDVSRISRGKIVLRKRATNLAELVRDVVRDLKGSYDAAGLELVVDGTESPTWVDADPVRIAQVIGNLLHNARKFTPRGGNVTIVLDRNSSVALLKVVDTGIGIEPENIDRVFTTFYQSDRSLDRTAGGLGLGLALVKGLIDLHGGTVRVSSAGANKGAEFAIELSACPAPPPQSHKAPVKRERGRYRVLVIDDHRDTLQTMNALLARLGQETVTGESGEEALKAVADFRPDVILSDIGLPGMDGYAVARRIRTDPSLRPRRLVAVTGYGQPADQERAFEAGFDQHLTKPVGMDDLCRILDELSEV